MSTDSERRRGHETGAGPRSRGTGSPVTTGNRPLFSADSYFPTPPRELQSPRAVRDTRAGAIEIADELVIYNRDKSEAWLQSDLGVELGAVR